MKYNRLTFENRVNSEEVKPYLDFIIDGKSLKTHLGEADDAVTPFGWGINKDFELKNAQRLLSFKKSEFGNGLQSAYVCADCGDEGCGAIMFDIISHGSYVEWSGFVNSDGFPTDSDPDETIDIEPFYFEMDEY